MEVFFSSGFAFSNINVDDRLRFKIAWTYDTRAITQGNQIGFNLSIMYTYDYDLTLYDL